MMFILQLLSIFSLLTVNTLVSSTSFMTDCQIIDGQTFQPNSTTSLLASYQFLASFSPIPIDCAHVCLRWSNCRTVVFEQYSKTCRMYSESAASSGSLVTNSTDIFTTIITDKPPSKLVVVPRNQNVSAIWNATAGQNSLPATPGTGVGNYWSAHSPANVFDGNWTTVFASYGVGNYTFYSNMSGLNTGVYVTIPGSPFILTAFRFITNVGFSARDPMKLTIEGSNLVGSALTLGSSWTLIYNGTTGLDVNPGRTQPGVQQTLNNNILAFSSYRFIITARRVLETCVDYADIELYGP